MDLPVNRFKHRLAAGEVQIGLWMTLANPVAAEMCAAAEFDWLAIDAEHSPNDVRTILAQLQSAAAYSASVMVRLPSQDPVIIKRILDVGAQTLIAPMVETGDQAKHLVAAMRYAPEGIRGLATTNRAARWTRVTDYAKAAHTELCLIVQIETRTALDNIEAIASVPGVDALFIGPGDLAASLGYIGEPKHPAVQAAIEKAIERILASGKPAGAFSVDDEMTKRCLNLGCSFVSVGSDGVLLAHAVDDLRRRHLG